MKYLSIVFQFNHKNLLVFVASISMQKHWIIFLISEVVSLLYGIIRRKYKNYFLLGKSLEKYDLYQGEITNQATNEQPANNQRITTTKERKNNTNINISINTYRQFAHLSISQDEFQKLITLWFSKVQIDEILDQIENYKGNTKYKSLFLTTKNWLQKESASAIQRATQTLWVGKSSAKKEKPSHERDRDNFTF